jgi:phosphatidylinositol-3,4,5-trisphosphate 3-phosphatase/dual-specificity protein phosphatase PTEN
MGFPSEGSEAAYRNPLPQVQLFFKTFHAGVYKIYNLCSERKYEHAKFEACENGQVAEYPFDDHNAPSFHQIVDFCVDVHAWLAKKAENVAAVHCKAGKGRTGLMISCYLLFCGTCAHPDAALTYFATHRTSNGKGVTIPSQLRYVHYFHLYLTNYFDVNRPFPFTGVPMLLTHVRLTGIPKFDLVSGGCDPFFTIFQGERCVFDFQQFKLTTGGAGSRSGASGGLISSSSGTDATSSGDGRRDAADHVDFKVFVWLKADCKFLLYERDRLGRSQKIAWFWFHTSFLASTGSSHLSLAKREVDGAIKDKESKHFPPHFKIELAFKPASETAFADPRDEREHLFTKANNLAKKAHQTRAEAESAVADDSEEDDEDTHEPTPFVTPFDLTAAAEADTVCHARALEDYEEWQAEADEAATLFQPELPPS